MTRGERCITCADEGVIARVIELDASTGLARCAGEQGEELAVEVAFVDAVAAGDALLVHAGVALARVEDA
jgi:hydrogenase maturation factor